MVDDGRCPLCARAVPGLPGTDAPCVRCGVFVRIPEGDAPVAPRLAVPSPIVAGPIVPAAAVPSSSHRVEKARASRRPGRALRWVAVFAVLLLVAGALGAQAYFSLPPSTRKVEKRLVGWDAAGEGDAYEIFGYENQQGEFSNRFRRVVDLGGKEFLLENQYRIYHQRGEEYYISFSQEYRGAPREPTIGRNLDPDLPFEPMPAKITNRTGRSYTGIIGSHPFTLQVDEEARFQSLQYQNHRGGQVRLHYGYAGVGFPPFVRAAASGEEERSVSEDEIVYTSLPRNAANFPQPERGSYKSRVIIDWIQDFRPASDFLVRFTDGSGELMAETPMNNVALPGGFAFNWEDRNGNGLVDEGDVYTYNHPQGLVMSFYDVWARHPVGSPRREGPWDPQWDLVTPSWRLYNLRQSS